MQIIKPSEISGKIMTLIDEAKESMVIISPYYNITNWNKLLLKIEKAKDRNVKFQFYVRKPEHEGEERNIQEVEKIGVKPIEIERLHAKIYFNEIDAIIASMNLDSRSDTASLDIGMITESKKEYNDVIDFYEKNIKGREIKNYSTCNKLIQLIDNSVSGVFDRGVRIYYEDNVITINGNNVYTVFIANEKSNLLRLNCILSEHEYNFLKSNPNLFQTGKMDIKLQEARDGYYSLIWGTVDKIQSFSVEKIVKNEEKLIVQYIVGFIKGVEAAKKMAKT